MAAIVFDNIIKYQRKQINLGMWNLKMYAITMPI